tara:strand:- start:854 stop:2167 length:1314 start_codon:yes stop_codon:yes gene_type:complete
MSYKQMTGNLISATKLVPTANSSSAYGVATGVWNLNDMYDYKRGGQWPIPAGVPGAPTISGVTGGDAQVAVAFNANADNGGLTVSSFTATASSGQTASGSSSPLTVTSLTNGNAITFTVTATNASGTSSASSASSSVTPVTPPRGLILGGGNTSALNIIEYITISSTGNATDFGNLTETKKGVGAYSSKTRAVAHAGQKEASPYYLNIIDYVTIASTGNATDFGDAMSIKAYGAGFSNIVRGYFAGGVDNGTAEAQIEQTTISSTGNATNFGNLVGVRNNLGDAGCATSTRGIIFGGYEDGGSNAVNQIQYISIGSSGNASDFGDMSATSYSLMACSSGTRAVRAGGFAINNVMEYITIANTGNTTDFGDLTAGRAIGGGTSSSTRGVFGGGQNDSNRLNIIDYITIANTGNASDFGDLTATRIHCGMTSSDHGGVQ